MEGIDALCAALNEETCACRALVAVLRRERQAMAALEPRAILACLVERRTLRDQLAELVARRRTLVRGLAPGRDTVRAAELLVELPPEAAAGLRSRLRELRGALLEARALERHNVALARVGQEALDGLARAARARTRQAPCEGRGPRPAAQVTPLRLP